MPNEKYKANMKGIIQGISGSIIGCMLNAVFLEYLVKADPGSGTLATFGQYVFIAIEGFVFTMKCGTKKRIIPLKSYFSVVAMFLIANVSNNYVFKFNISMPLHMIFRSGSLITNMILGIIMLKKRYTVMKFFSVGLISVGVTICTLVTGSEMKNEAATSVAGDDSFFWWLFGISILVAALLVSSILGIFQESLYLRYGKHPNEALFYTHLLPLPIFLFFGANIWEHFNTAMLSPPLDIPFTNLSIPSTMLYLLGNIVTQYMCIKSVYLLATEASSLTVTLVLTLRKFLSLLLSIVYFNNTFTLYHWLGTICVFIGTIIFTEIPQTVFGSSGTTAKKKK